MTPKDRALKELRFVLREVEGHREGYQHSGARDTVSALRGIERMIEKRIDEVKKEPDEETT